MDDAERVAAVRRRVVRCGAASALVALLLLVWRLFLLLCPLRDWAVLAWSLEPADAATWTAPQIPALVAENALENGGPVGSAVGRRLYGRAVVPTGRGSPPGQPPPYAAVHLAEAWDGGTGIWWCVRPWTGVPPDMPLYVQLPMHCPVPAASARAVAVQVYVEAHLAEAVRYAGCVETQPVPAGIWRDYLVVRTALGWRVEGVYVMDDGRPLVRGPAVATGTASALLAGCG